MFQGKEAPDPENYPIGYTAAEGRSSNNSEGLCSTTTKDMS